MTSFRVVDPKTGEDMVFDEAILEEDWIKNSGLVIYDIDSFALLENGQLILTDECGNFAYVPEGRFKVVSDSVSVHGKWIEERRVCKNINPGVEYSVFTCSNCGNKIKSAKENFCCVCGTDMRERKKPDESR